MHKIYKYNGKAFLNINELQKKKIIEFENEINIKNFKLIENNCLCGQIGSDLQISSRDRYGIRVYNFLCSNCGLVRQNPTLDEDSLKNFYQNYYREIYEGQEHHLNFERIFLSQEQSGEKIYELLQNILDKKKLSIKKFNKVLEIGCGPGGILSFFKKKGHDVTGVDYDNNYASMINKKNIKFISDDFMNESFKGEYDIIILSHVIEHFLDIGRVVNKLNKI